MTPMPIEDELKKALRRQEPPEGFDDRVLARIAAQDSAQRKVASNPWLRIFSQPLVRWTAFAAISACLVGGVRFAEVQHDKAIRERAEGEAAKQRLMLALRIAGSKLQLAKSKVDQLNAGPSDSEKE